MKLLSSNFQGIASPEIKLALRRLLKFEHIDVVFLQETLGLAEAITHHLESMLPGWFFQALDVNGHSGGIVLGYNPRSIKLCNIWGDIEYIGADIFSFDLGTNIRLINVYGPFHDREIFWEHLLTSNILQPDNIILGGELNFSMGFSESWGHHAQVDPVFAFFENILENHSFIDIPSAKILPTWRNKRIGEDNLARRLDRFLIKERLLELGLIFK